MKPTLEDHLESLYLVDSVNHNLAVKYFHEIKKEYNLTCLEMSKMWIDYQLNRLKEDGYNFLPSNSRNNTLYDPSRNKLK